MGWGVLVTPPSPFVPSPPPRSGRFLVAGDTDGFVTVWDTLSPPRPGGGPEDPPLLTPTLRFRALHDCINGTRWRPGPPWDPPETPPREPPETPHSPGTPLGPP